MNRVILKMRLHPQAHAHIERFLCDYFVDEAVALPQLKIYCGAWTHGLAALFRIGAITVGKRIFVAPKYLVRDAVTKQLKLPGWLVAHEAVHVLQYRREGMLGFLGGYLREYLKNLFNQRRCGAKSRMTAYLAISYEAQAHAAEKAYVRWRQRRAQSNLW
ncbi:MAG: hypothetical protein WKF30_11440 [Pyrinomonadaceae bacterium]